MEPRTARRIVRRVGGAALEDIVSTQNPLVSTEIRHGEGLAAAPIKDWPHTPQDAQRQDGRKGTARPDAAHSPAYTEEWLERHLLKLRDPLYRFVRKVAGLTNTPEEEYWLWQGPVSAPEAADTAPAPVREPKKGEGEETLAQKARTPEGMLARILLSRDGGMTDADERAWRALYGQNAKKVPQTKEWMRSPEQLGWMFMSAEVETGIMAARNDVWNWARKPDFHLHHLMTHDGVYVEFARLAAAHINLFRTGGRYRQVYAQKRLDGALTQARRWFMCVEYNERGQLVYSRTDVLRNEREWKRRRGVAGFALPPPARKSRELFTDLYSD